MSTTGLILKIFNVSALFFLLIVYCSTFYGNLSNIPLSFFLRSRHKRLTPKSFNILFLILLSGDIELNPGPSHTNPGPSLTNFKLCTLNIRSLTNPLHITALSDLAETEKINLFALTETWVTPSTTFAELSDATPPNYNLTSFPRPVSPVNIKKSIIGGGTAFLLQNSFNIISTSSKIFKSFEMSSITIKLFSSKLTVFNIYRNHYLPHTASSKSPTKTSRPVVPFSDFFSDFSTLISNAATTPHDFLITGDFNIHTDVLSDPHSQQFLSLLDSANLTQHVTFPTHQDGHTLDLIITPKDIMLHLTITHSPISLSDHFSIFTFFRISLPALPPLTKHNFHRLKSINIPNFLHDLRTSLLITHPPTTLSDLVDCYNLTLSTLLN